MFCLSIVYLYIYNHPIHHQELQQERACMYILRKFKVNVSENGKVNLVFPVATNHR